MPKKLVSSAVMILIVLSGILTTLPLVKGADNVLISGYIRDSSNSNGISNATVYVEDVQGYSSSNLTLTNATGYYEVRVYAPWNGYLFRFTAFEGAYYSNSTYISPTIGNNTFNMSLDPAPPRNSSIGGLVMDATTLSPIPNATVLASSLDYMNQSITNSSGNYTMGVLSNRDYKITSTATGYARTSTTRRVGNAENLTVNFLMEPTNCLLKGYVSNLSGAINNAQVRIYRPGGEEYMAYTNGSGYFERNITRGIWQVEVSEANHFRETLTVIMENGNTTWQNFTLDELPSGRAQIHGFVFDYENGSALNTSWLYVQNQYGTWSAFYSSNATGEINASSIPGDITLIAGASGYITDYITLNLSSGIDYWQNWTLSRDAESSIITGRVLNGSSGTGEGNVHLIFTVGTYRNETYTDSGGNYTIGVPAGEIRVLAIKDAFVTKNATIFTSSGKTTYLNLTIESLVFDNIIKGYITDSITGKEIKRAQIYAGNSASWSLAASVDYRGYYQLLAPQDYASLTAAAEGYRTEIREMHLSNGSTGWANFSMNPVNFTSRINGRLLDIQTGSPLRRVSISAYSEDRRWYTTAETDNTGRFRFNTPSGKTILQFNTADNGFEDVGEMYFLLSSGETRWLNLSFYPLPKTSRFMGHVNNSSSGLPNAVITVEYGDTVRSTLTNSTGYYEIYLPEARIDARARAPGYRAQKIYGISLSSDTGYWQNWTMLSSPAWFEGAPSDSVGDTDTDGLWNYLYVDVPVNASTAGTYRIKGELTEGHTATDTITTAVNTTYLPSGTGTVRLAFRGELIRASNRSGYFVQLSLYNDQNGEFLDETEFYTTPHSSSEFDSPDAIVDTPIEEWVVDTDYDGLYNQLVFNLTVNASKGGNYTIISVLYDVNWNEVDMKTYYDSFSAGDSQVQLSFPGTRIYDNGANLWSAAFIITDDVGGEGDFYFFYTFKYIYYHYEDFQHYPITSGVSGYVYDEQGTPISGIDVMLYNVSHRSLNSTVTNASGYYELGGWEGEWLLAIDDLDSGTSVYQGNLTEIYLYANQTDWENRSLPFTPPDDYTENIVFHDWNNASLEQIFISNADNETIRFEMDVLRIGDGDGYLSESEAAIIRDLMLQDWNMPADTTDNFLVDNTGYYLNNGTSTTDLGIVGPVSSSEPIYIHSAGNYTASAAPSYIPHYLELNCTYDNTDAGLFTGNNITARYHISPPSGWGRSGNNTTVNVTISGSDYITADPGGDPVSGDGIFWEWVNMTISSTAPSTGTIKGNVSLQGSSDGSGVTVTVYDNLTSAEVTCGYTDTSGMYSIYGLPNGTYDIVASKPGYITESSLGRPISAGETLWIDFTLASYPPVISHTPPPDALINESVKVYADVTDEGGVDTVLLYYMGVNASSFTPVTMERIGISSTYTATIPAQNYPGLVSYYLWANDTAGNNATDPESGNHTLRIYETSSPLISGVQDVPDPAEYPEAVNVSATVKDMALYGVWLNVTYPSGNSTNLSMTYDSGSDRYYMNSSYVEVGFYTYTIWANDTSGNWASSSGNFTVVDTTKPVIAGTDAAPSPLEGPGIVNISANISDASGIASAYLFVEGPGGTIGNFSMILYSGNTYYYSTTYSDTGLYNYTIWAEDNHGLISSYSGNFTVQDTRAPVISGISVSPDPAEMGSTANISANITDSYGILEAWINISFNGVFVGNFSMKNSGASYWHLFTPSESGTANITIWAEDTNSLWNSSFYTFQAIDGHPPEINSVSITPTGPVELGSRINITASIYDLSGISSAALTISDPYGIEIFNDTIDFNQSRCWYEFTPPGIGNYSVELRVRDSSGLWNSTTASFDVVDTVAPEISSLSTYPDPQEVFDPVNVSAVITDISGISGVTILLRDPGGDILGNYTMNHTGDIYYYNVTYSVVGRYTFTIWATDNNGLIRHLEGSVDIEDAEKPVADAGNPRQVYVGDTVTFDGSGSTDNYGISNYTWTFEYNGTKTLYGESIQYTFDEQGNYTITLEVRDFSDNTATDSIWIQVIANTGVITGRVEDSSGNPIQGARVRVEGVSTESYTDADGGFTLSGVPPGIQTLIVSLKGYNTVRTTVTVTAGDTVQTGTISMEESSSTGESLPIWWPLLALLLLLMGGIITYAVIKRRATAAEKKKTIIDEIFFIYKDGKLIKHFTRRLRPDMDQDILSGMLVAVQEFVKDSFGDEGGSLEEMKFGRFQIVIGKGEHIILAAVVIGDEIEPIKPQLKRCIEDIEEKYGDVLKDWSGDMDEVRGTFRYVMNLIDGKYE